MKNKPKGVRYLSQLRIAASHLLSVAFVLEVLFPVRLAEAAPSTERPTTYLWAWEVATDLSSLSRSDVGIAFLAATVEGRIERTTARMRRAKLILPKNAHSPLPVVRIHSFGRRFLRNDIDSSKVILATIEKVLRDFPNSQIQLDFDALNSERPFYEQLLTSIRADLCRVGECFLSITALGSWCLPGDQWVTSLPIDEVVPMAFSLGPTFERGRFVEALNGAKAPCNTAIGMLHNDHFSLDGRRTRYLFTNQSWNASNLASIGG